MMTGVRHRLSRRHLLAAGSATLAAAALGLPVAAKAAYRESKVTNGGIFKGIARFKGTPPKPDQILISKDQHHCGEGFVVPDPVTIGADGGLSDVVVAIKEVAEGKPWPAAERAPKIVQAKCKFLPFVQVAPKGAELTIVNEDPLLHNIHAYELIGRARRTMFNIAQPSAGQVDKNPLRMRRGHVVEIDCDAHNWMSAWIYTADHPYLTTVDAKAAYAIEDVPPGSYELIAWHPVLGQVSKSVEIAAGKTVPVDFEFTSKSTAG